MESLNSALSTAVRVEAVRKGLTLKEVREAAGFGHTMFNSRLSGESTWNTEELDKLAKALGMGDGWALYEIAAEEHRRELAA